MGLMLLQEVCPLISLMRTSSKCSSVSSVLTQFFTTATLSDVVFDSEEKGTIKGNPESYQYINRFLPGVVKKCTIDGTPIAAEKWEHEFYEDSGVGSFTEIARCNPGNDLIHNSRDYIGEDKNGHNLPIDDKILNDESAGRYEYITTKAGSRLFSIGFAQGCDVGLSSLKT